MSWLYRRLVRPALFTQDSEAIHNHTIAALTKISRSSLLCSTLSAIYSAPELPVELFGLRFPNPVGLAAGMDKHAAAVPAWEALGFGFAELGGVTWHVQPGNPAPRMFRAIPDEALINRMGFNNPGAEAMAGTLREWRASGRWPKHPVGINLGKSKITPNEEAADDYANSFRLLRPLADFFVVNVSSPNTPNLRQLQDKAALDEILAALQQINEAGESKAKPILVKVGPDLTFEALDEILELAVSRNLAGIVATNTTITRTQSKDQKLQRVYGETGGLSGRPLRARSTEVIRHIRRQTHGALPIIGVGGIFNADDAWEKIEAGASLLQVYTGLVYEGPALVKDIVNGLRVRMQQHGLTQLKDACGHSR
ncbi:MAG TPA: quinone-dependent dihydroorotate dehydrogenase [Candidatus Limnocylindria bacterium]|nr:quinone-dependent dihydroorotate dehydrogenase [Candidatus Limnocylindria bacterium]